MEKPALENKILHLVIFLKYSNGYTTGAPSVNCEEMNSIPQVTQYERPSSSLTAFCGNGLNSLLDNTILRSAFAIGIPAASTTAVSPDSPRQERKLFVGLLPRIYSEVDVISMFEPFGKIEECLVLRSNARQSRGQSRGCAFVIFMTRQSALNAIEAMRSHKRLVVKFPDTPKERDRRRLDKFYRDLSYITIIGQQLGTFSVSPTARSSVTGSANAAATGASLLNALSSPLKGIASTVLSDVPDDYNDFTYNYNQMAPRYAGNVKGAKQHHQTQLVGPDGANLFVFNMPIFLDDGKLRVLFSCFGTVISAKVIINKVTNMSKCFGFVSYDNILSAQAAIQILNGYRFNGKKMGVELELKKPY